MTLRVGARSQITMDGRESRRWRYGIHEMASAITVFGFEAHLVSKAHAIKKYNVRSNEWKLLFSLNLKILCFAVYRTFLFWAPLPQAPKLLSGFPRQFDFPGWPHVLWPLGFLHLLLSTLKLLLESYHIGKGLDKLILTKLKMNDSCCVLTLGLGVLLIH